MSDNLIMINVRYGNGTYIARAKGMNKTASCTKSAEMACDSLCEKLFGDRPFTMTRYGNSNTWIVEGNENKTN